MDLVRMRVCALLVVIAAFAAVAPAGAEDAAPAPCDGLLMTDPKDDAAFYQQPLLAGTPDATAWPSGDVTGFWMDYRTGADGKKYLRTNIQIQNLTKEVPGAEYATAMGWHASFDTPEDFYFTRVHSDGKAYKFQFGSFNRPLNGAAPVDPGQPVWVDVPGVAIEGPGGIVSVEVPTDKLKGFTDTVKFTGIDVRTYADWPNSTSNSRIDIAPDTGAKEWTTKECTLDAAPTPEASATPVAEAPAPGQPQQQQQQPGQQPQSRQESPSSLPFTAGASIGSARKVAKKRSFALKVSSSRAISNLVVVVKKGTQVIARGKLATLNGNGVVKLKFNAKRAKAGKYALVAMGTVDGRSLSVTRAVKLAK
jgi:hypothetical protein